MSQHLGECKENLQNDKETNTKRASDIPALILILKKEMENTDTVDATLQQIQNTNNNKGKKGEYYIMQYKYCFLKKLPKLVKQYCYYYYK